MAPAKRTRTQADASEAKKARVVDPIAEKVEVITQMLADPECQIGESHREMLLASVPHTLTVPCDKRHEYETAMARMVETVLKAHVVEQETKVSDAQAKVDSTEQQSGEAVNGLMASASRVQAQEDEAARCQEVLRVDSEAVKASHEAVEVATKEVADFDENLQVTIGEKELCDSVYNECFLLLKSDSSSEAPKLLKRMEPVLKKLGTEGSLMSAIAPALKKSTAERGPFDAMAIEGVEAVFTKHLASLQEQIDRADISKAEKVAAQGAMQEALDAAKGKEAASEQGLKEVQAALSSLEAQHQEMYQHTESLSKVAMEAVTEHGIKGEILTKARQVLSTFTELFERTEQVKTDETMDKVDQAMPEPLCMPSPMKSVEAA